MVASEVAGVEPLSLVAVTTIRRVCPTSPAVSLCVLPIARRCWRRCFAFGVAVLPLVFVAGGGVFPGAVVVVSVSPTASVPLIVGGVFATGTTLTGELGISGEPASGAKTIAGTGLGACGDLGVEWLGLRRWRMAQQHDGWRRRWRPDAADLVVRRRWASRHPGYWAAPASGGSGRVWPLMSVAG